jgi:MerR family transcriptional regulator, glutamine synthetase repressor
MFSEGGVSVNDDIRRKTPLFPISIVSRLTELTARQIRYYEKYGLVNPVRTEGNQRLFSFHDVDKLLKIKSHLEKGYNLTNLKEMFDPKEQNKVVKEKRTGELSEAELHRMLHRDLFSGDKHKTPLTQGELSRFFRP